MYTDSDFVYSLYYNFIQVVKYRRKIFTNGAVVNLPKMKTDETPYSFNVDILGI
jgi:REP element-mobilizing transposase RayT